MINQSTMTPEIVQISAEATDKCKEGVKEKTFEWETNSGEYMCGYLGKGTS